MNILVGGNRRSEAGPEGVKLHLSRSGSSGLCVCVCPRLYSQDLFHFVHLQCVIFHCSPLFLRSLCVLSWLLGTLHS